MGVGGDVSQTLPNQVIRKWMVNTTLAKGHHAQTQHNARNLLMFHTIAVHLIKTTLFFVTGDDNIARFDSWRYMKDEVSGVKRREWRMKRML